MGEGPRIGILGGTFDPVHVTHVRLARAALAAGRLDRVLFVVAARPPHKTEGPYATAEERLAMVRAALVDEAGLEACDVELSRPGLSYTYDTVCALEGMYPGASFFLIVGYDMLLDLPKWRNARELLSKAGVLAAHRPGQERCVPGALEGKYKLIPFEETALSSTEIRNRVDAGEDVSGLMPDGVVAYIRAHRLYEVPLEVRAMPRAGAFIQLLGERLSDATRRHCLGTGEMMLPCAGLLGLDAEQAVYAGLLHDLAKGLGKREMIAAAEGYGVAVSDVQHLAPGLLHGPIGAEMARQDLGIEDRDVYDAIYWHTTGRPGLGRLGQALYVSDFSERRRSFPEAAVAREVLFGEGFEAALGFVARDKIRRLGVKGAVVDPVSEAFLAWVEGRVGVC